MYRVLIVDDEKMIRMGMKNAIDWKKLGVDDVFTAASGNEALKSLKEESPEIMVKEEAEGNINDMVSVDKKVLKLWLQISR